MRSNFLTKSSILICALSVPLAMTSACGTSTHENLTQGQVNDSSNGKINVVAAEDFYGEVVQAVGGNHVNVTSILNNPATDPHEYEPTPNATREVSKSQLVIYTGIGYDEWMQKLIEADSSHTPKVVNVGHDVLGKQDGDNPHVWYTPTTMPKLASTIASDLSELDPAHAQDYADGAQAYIKTLNPLQTMIQRLKQSTPLPIDVSEPVFDNMAEAMNMTVGDPKFAKAIEDGNEPTPTDIVQLQNDIKTKRIKLFIENIQTDDPTVKSMAVLAKANHIPVIQVTETEPAGEDYLRWMMEQLHQVESSLGK
jgi:zinc/manganese transport system substrate-binding protein